MSEEFKELSERLDMPVENIENLFTVAGICTPQNNISLSLARLSYFISKKLLPKIQAETARRRNLLLNEEKLAKLVQRHELKFGIKPTLPEYIGLEVRMDLIRNAVTFGVPHDESWSALKHMYFEIFYSSPPSCKEGDEENWVDLVLTAISLKHPIKDEAGVEYVNSTHFKARQAPEVNP